ncbi:ATP-dependent DNA helicase [Trichonephila clavipes]|nr:ATP-dependent DNA helicase [Trichonephila clavipes]
MGDKEAQVNRRSEYIQGVERDTVQQVLHDHNILVHEFKMAKDRVTSDNYKLVIHPDHIPHGEYERRFNASTTNEIAALVVSSERTASQDSVIQAHDGRLTRVPDTHRFYDALEYPIIFWIGQEGYSFDIPQLNPFTKQPIPNKKCPAKTFMHIKMVLRNNFNLLLQCRLLFHQFLVDIYVKVEIEHLRFIALNQTKLQAENYIHLQDVIRNNADLDPNSLGQMRMATTPKTTLTAFFLLCQNDAFAKTLLYVDVPRYYTWSVSLREWKCRVQGTPIDGWPDVKAGHALGRIYTVHVSNFECYCLRMLLNAIQGPTNFSDLKTVDGQEFETFCQACEKLGLLEVDNHWDATMEEAVLCRSPSQIRELFAILICTCGLSNPLQLWDKYKVALSEDILHRFEKKGHVNNDLCLNEALRHIEDKIIRISRKKMSDIGMPTPQRRGELLTDLIKELGFNTALLDTQDRNVALDVASSGIAATLMSGGRTAHSVFKLPLNLASEETPTCNISKNSACGALLQQCKLIVWDEYPMSHKRAIELLDRCLQDIQNNRKLMGGAVVLLAGGFRQTLPVIERGTAADEINACLKASYLWTKVEKLCLTTNMQVQLFSDDESGAYAQRLLEIGEGHLDTDQEGMVLFTHQFCHVVQSEDEPIDQVFPNIQHILDEKWFCERTILAPKNETCENK